MHRATITSRALLLAVLPFIASCASSTADGSGTVQPPSPVPVPVTPPGIVLEPSEAELRAADRAELDGNELGLMWTFEDPPLAYWAAEYEFEPTPEWLERVRLASVRYGEYCSGSFVSPDGLVMTNHHCARECIEANSTGDTDYVETGFLAANRSQERECPGLYLDQLVSTEDVTERVHGAAAAGATPQEIATARAEEAARIEAECAEGEEDRHCQVVALYYGARYHLYEYRRFAPVKLVFAPDLQAGFFGGDPDNFTYPRYTLDVSFVRAYQPDGERPADTGDHYFPWDAEGADEGELIFITGNPGTTSRLITVAQLLYEQEYRHPFLIQLLEGQRALLMRIAAQGEEAEQSVRQQLFEIENSLKAYSGQYAGLLDTLLVGTKIKWERELRERIAAAPALQSEYGDVWDRMEDVQRRKMALSPRLNVANAQLVGAPHLSYAAQLAVYITEMARPEADRSEQFRTQAQQIENALRTPTAVDEQVAHSLLALQLEIARRWLTPGDPLLRGLFVDAQESADEAAERLIRSSRVLDIDFRDRIMRGGPDSLAASDDPLLAFARDAAVLYDSLQTQWAALIAEEAVLKERLATAALAATGAEFPPDATFTLRIADGVVSRFPFNGTVAPPVTNYYGMYARSAAFENEMPWTMPEALVENRARIDMAVPLNFVSTNDLTGGNSGSPMIDAEGRIVGLAFDSNIDFLPGVFVYDTTTGRAISVHSAGIIEALRDAYRARALVAELTAR